MNISRPNTLNMSHFSTLKHAELLSVLSCHLLPRSPSDPFPTLLHLHSHLCLQNANWKTHQPPQRIQIIHNPRQEYAQHPKCRQFAGGKEVHAIRQADNGDRHFYDVTEPPADQEVPKGHILPRWEVGAMRSHNNAPLHTSYKKTFYD